MAQKRLRAAAVAMKAGNSELFYQETLNALWGYVSYKLNIAASELNRDNISDHLTRRGTNAALIQSFIVCLIIASMLAMPRVLIRVKRWIACTRIVYPLSRNWIRDMKTKN